MALLGSFLPPLPKPPDPSLSHMLMRRRPLSLRAPPLCVHAFAQKPKSAALLLLHALVCLSKIEHS